MSEWISVKERVPRQDEYVLIWDGKEIAIAAPNMFAEWSDQDFWAYEPTHWMPLPEPPK